MLIVSPTSFKVSQGSTLILCSSHLKFFSLTCEDVSDLAAAGESIELSSFGEGEITDITKMQDGLNNLRDLLKEDLSDVTRFISDPRSGLTDFKRIAAQFGVDGTVTGLIGVSLNFIIHYGDRNDDGKDSNNSGGHQTTATATATSSTGTTTPTSWLLFTMPGTSREAFEDFVSNLPDRGSGERTVFPSLDYQNYVGKMTLEEAKEVSKNPIVDQIGSNEPIIDEDEDEDACICPVGRNVVTM